MPLAKHQGPAISHRLHRAKGEVGLATTNIAQTLPMVSNRWQRGRGGTGGSLGAGGGEESPVAGESNVETPSGRCVL
jgi:hypothetical protein